MTGEDPPAPQDTVVSPLAAAPPLPVESGPPVPTPESPPASDTVDAPIASVDHPPPRADGGAFTMHQVDGRFSTDSMATQDLPRGLLGFVVFDFAGGKKRKLICHWQTPAVLQTSCAQLERNLALPSAVLPVRTPRKIHRKMSAWVKELPLVAVATVAGFLLSVLAAHELLAAFYHRRLAHTPLDVSVRAIKATLDVQPGKPFTARFAVENYTNWHKPYVRVRATLVRPSDGATFPARLDPPDIPVIDTSGRVYVEASGQIDEPGRYKLEVTSLPLYDMPPAEARRSAWDDFAARSPKDGSLQSDATSIVSHANEEFTNQRLDPASTDNKTRCIMTVTLTTGRTYSNGLRITGYTPSKSQTWFHSVFPTRDGKYDAGASDEKTIQNGAFVTWETEKMEALESRTFQIALEARLEYSRQEWQQLIEKISFSAGPVPEVKSP